MTPYRVFASGQTAPKKGHRQHLSTLTTFRTFDNQAPVVEAMLRERARRALYLNCDRAPISWDAASV